MTEAMRAWIELQATATEMVSTVAYAEVLAVYAAGLEVVVRPPEALVRRTLGQVLRGEPRWYPEHETFCGFVRRAVRAEVMRQVGLHARLRGGPGEHLAPTQVGALAGLEPIIHWAGELAGYVRQRDHALVPMALRLVTYVREELLRAELDSTHEGAER